MSHNKTNNRGQYNLYILLKFIKHSVKLRELQELLLANKELMGAKKCN